MKRKKSKQNDLNVQDVKEGTLKELILSEDFSKNAQFANIEKKYLKQVESFVKKKLRRASLQWPPRNEAIKKARVERGFYKCNDCSRWVGPKEFQLDHKQPVQPIGQEISLIEWIFRLLSPVDNWAVLCLSCHSSKTDHENMLREIRKPKKSKKSKT